MACVNTKSKDFKAIQKKYNASSGTVENAIKIWLDRTNSEEYNPDSPEFQSHLADYFKQGNSNVFSSKSEYTRAKTVWDSLVKPFRDTDTLPTYTNKNEAQKAKQKMDNIFGEDQVTMYESPTGEYIINVAEPIYNKEKVQSAEQELEKVLTPETSPFEEAENLVRRLKEDSKEHIKFNPEDHSYEVDGVKADTSVTQYIHGKKDLGAWGIPSSAIGTTADTITRDFFAGDLKKEYPNMSKKDLRNLVSDLKDLKKYFDKRFGEGKYKIVADEFPIAAKYTVQDKNGNSITKVMAGTMDLFIYDDKGNFYIYDMKTSRSGISDGKKEGYSKQLTLYKAILEANYPELRGKIKELKVIQFNVGYPSPYNRDGNIVNIYETGDTELGEDAGQLYINEVAVQDSGEYSAPRLNITDSIEDALIPLEEQDIEAQFEALSPEEKASMEEEIGDKPVKLSKFEQDEENSQRGNLYGNPIITASERTFLANNVMGMTSFIITHLQTAQEANEHYFGDTFAGVDFTKMSRQDIINKVGVGRVFNYIKESFYNPDNRTDIEDFDTLDKLQLAYDNWSALIKSAYAKLITLEGVTVIDSAPEDITREDVEDSFQEELDSGALEEHEREYWQIGQRQISARSSLSGEIRRTFERLKAVDSDGNPIKDKYGFGFDTFVDAGTAVNGILDWVKEATTMKEMEDILKEMAPSYPWLNAILDKIQDEPFRSQFFQNFRKDFTQYSIITVEYDEKGNRKYVTNIINTKGATKTILDNVQTVFKEGLMPNLIIPIKGDIEGRGRVNTDKVEQLKELRNSITSKLRDAFTNQRVFRTAINNAVPDITSLLNQIGIEVTPDSIRSALSKDAYFKQLTSAKSTKILNEVSYLLDTLLDNKDNQTYNPLEKGAEGNIYGNYRNIVRELSRYIQDSIESSTYENGKMHYSFVTPSYMGKLILNLKDALGNRDKFRDFMQENYGKYRWFKDGNTWNNEWLQLINDDTNMRQALEHKVQLSFDKTPYTDLSEVGYTLSMMNEYFYDKAKKYAWYRVPILSNKPSSEFIKFKRYSGKNYKRNITAGLKKVMNQEILRMKTALERASNPDIESISNFDISKKVLNKNPKLAEKIANKEVLTIDDLVKDGKLVLEGSGAEFKFLSALNQNIINKDELGMMIVNKLNGIEVDEVAFDTAFQYAVNSYMNAMVASEMRQWGEIGLFDTETITKYVKGKKETEERYKYISQFGKTDEEIQGALEEYIWNDMFATINIIELTATDLAYYKNVEDFQKRYAQVHSPAMRLNTEAKDSKGALYSKDGKTRTIYVADNIVVSEIIPNVEAVLNNKIDSITNPTEKAHMRMMKDLIISSFKGINVADAQGYSSPTSYRKKMGMSGKWDDSMEEAYDRIKKGNFNVNDLGVVWQPLKPFVYSQITKESGAESMVNLKVPVQNKNSEYLLILADAITRGGNKVNRLTAIFDFMEDSAYDGRISENGKVIKEGTYNGIGIDTVQFESSVKSGKMGVIDINDLESYEDIKSVLNEATYFDSSKMEVEENGMDRYNDQYIHTIPFEDYGIQQEVPAHLIDHNQLMGSQMRILSISDITPGTIFKIGDREMKDAELVDTYQKLIADNVRDSFDKLMKALKIEGTKVERNQALSKLLTEAIQKDQRYGADLLRACSLNENGDFVIPLSDPIQSVRIQQLINSIIKSRINKQTIKGGPVVQASVFGLSDDLNIRWKDKKGNLLKTRQEFMNEQGENFTDESYSKYVQDNQDSVAYFECYMPIPSSALEQAMTKADGSIMSIEETVKEGIIPDEMRKAIGYRIPTEDKYSMAPLYIKGFLPKAAGEAIMLPKEITLLSGSDFDIDKMYVMLKEFQRRDTTNWGLLKKDILKNIPEGVRKKEAIDKLDIAIDMIRNGNISFEEESFEMSVFDYYQDHLSRYNRFEFIQKGSDNIGERNNQIFDLQWAVLTNADTMDKMFNPGSFDVQKKSARIIEILKATNKYSYEDLSKMNLNQLDEISESTSGRNIIFSTTQAYFHKQNMTAAKLIGIFANNNTSHAFLSLQDIYLKPGKDYSFTFNGVTVSDSENNKIDALVGKDGTLISKTIAGFLAASVDAVKDPVLNFMNLNTFTAGSAMTLARLGFDSDSIGMLLTQPIIEKVTREYFKRNNEGYASADDIIQEELNLLQEVEGIDYRRLKKDLVNTDFTKEELSNGITKGDMGTEFQVRALLLFQNLATISQDLNTLTFLTKFNSVTNAVGPMIADTLVMRERYNKFLDKMETNPLFSGNAARVIDNSPILESFYDTTVSDMGASRRIFEGYFPHYSSAFSTILDRLRQTTKANLDSKTINKLANDFILYKLTIGDNPVLDSNYQVRNEFINGFVERFKKEASGIIDNDLIKVITLKGRDSKCPVPTLEAKTGGYTIDVQERVKDGWSTLISNPATRKLGVELFFYNMFRSGFSFSPKTFMHLASVDVKQAIEGYVENLRNPEFNDSSVIADEFLNQYRRNHTQDFRIVPKFSENKYVKVTESKSVSKEKIITFAFNKNKEGMNSIIVKDSKEGTVYAPVITYNDRVYMNPVDDGSSVSYTETTSLGNPNNFLEYNAGEGTGIKSVIGQTTVADKQEYNSLSNDSIEEADKPQEDTALTPEEQHYVMNEVFAPEEAASIMGMTSDEAALEKFTELLSKYAEAESSNQAKDKLKKILRKLC